MKYKSRRKLSIVILIIGLPLYIITAVFIMSFFPRSNLFLEFFVYVFLGVVWALPFKFIFKGIGQIEKQDN